MNITFLLFLLFVLLNILDGVTTYISLKNQSIKELNPVLRALFAKIGVPFGLIAFKVPFLVVIWLSYFKLGWFTEYAFSLFLLLFNFVYFAIVINNIIVLIKAKKDS